MNSPSDHREKPPVDGLLINEAQVKQYKVNRFLYDLIGEAWNWTDKANWPQERWEAYAHADDLRTWIAWSQGSIAGYFELQRQIEGATEIAYFGLAPAFIGKGFGGPMLSTAINLAWQWGDTTRVIVNTCSLDHPGALANYRARGFEVYRTEQVEG